MEAAGGGLAQMPIDRAKVHDVLLYCYHQGGGWEGGRPADSSLFLYKSGWEMEATVLLRTLVPYFVSFSSCCGVFFFFSYFLFACVQCSFPFHR